jgi:hypothetical protein
MVNHYHFHEDSFVKPFFDHGLVDG